MRAKLIAILVSLIFFGVSVTGAYFYGRSDEKAHCSTKELTSELKGVDRHADIEREIMGMDVPSLDRGLSGWLRYE